MAAQVTDQFRILNANNFIESVENNANSYYVFVGLANPGSGTNDPQVGFGRTSAWDTNTPNPVDSINYISHYQDTMMYGKRVNSENIRRLIKKREWASGEQYEMYRHDYSVENQSPITKKSRLYDATYYVMNKNYNVYVCIDNGSSGINTTGNASQDEPLFTDLEPSRAGESGDGYIWKYLFTVPPSDIIKFDSTEYITVPNGWLTSTESQIQAVRDNGDSTVNNNQIKKIYIDNQGSGYKNVTDKEVDILGDGTGGKCVITTDSAGKIIKAVVSAGGKDYTYGMVDLGVLDGGNITVRAKLIPIIPPDKGHGANVYKELGTDKVLIYSRFDDKNKDFPIDTRFSQIGIVKNPTSYGSTSTYTASEFSSLKALKFNPSGNYDTNYPRIGQEIRQPLGSPAGAAGTAYGYVASWDKETAVLKYFQDRSLYYNSVLADQTDYGNVTKEAKVLPFESSGTSVISANFTGSLETTFSGITTTSITTNKIISLGTQFTAGISTEEINKGSGEVIYIDNRPLVPRNTRQKEDVKIILEF